MYWVYQPVYMRKNKKKTPKKQAKVKSFLNLEFHMQVKGSDPNNVMIKPLSIS